MTDQKPADIKYFGIRRGYIEILAFILLCIFALACIPHASAADISVNTTNGSYVIIEEPTPEPTVARTITPVNTATTKIVPRRIQQGECVEIGETIDIAGLGWYTGIIAYYGRYYDAYAAANVREIVDAKNVDTRELDNFYIDPNYFATRQGYWYNYDPFYSDKYESHGYDRLFKVLVTCPKTHEENVTAMQKKVEALNESKRQEALRAELLKLGVKTEPGAKYIISKNTNTTIAAPANSHEWILGLHNDDTYYDITIPKTNSATFTKEMTNSLPAGMYDVLFILPGENSIIEELYDRNEKLIYSPFKDTNTTDINGMIPSIAKTKLLERIRYSDDKEELWRVAIQEPSIQVTELSQDDLPNNQTYITLSGYTNANPGERIRFILDEQTTKGFVGITTAINNGGWGAYRAWNISFIVDFNNVFPGPHQITATTQTGATATVPIYVRDEPAANYNPPKHIRYVDNSPYIEPIYINTTITIIVPGPTQIVHRVITPSPEEIHEAGVSVAYSWVIPAVAIIIFIIIAWKFIAWMWSIYRRTKI